MALDRKIKENVEFIYPLDPSIKDDWKSKVGNIASYIQNFEEGFDKENIKKDEKPTSFLISSLTVDQYEESERIEDIVSKQRFVIKFGIKNISNFYFKGKLIKSEFEENMHFGIGLKD
jgi:hypothetical protein